MFRYLSAVVFAVVAVVMLVLPATQAGASAPSPTVGVAFARQGYGFWTLAADGSVVAYDNAMPHGSIWGIPHNAAAVAISVTPSGNGYWITTADGGVFAFGDAKFYGSAVRWVRSPVVSMAGTADGHGYWLLTKDGGVYAFGDAPFFGTSAPPNGAQAVAITNLGYGTLQGYTIAYSDGTVLTIENNKGGGADFGIKLNAPIVGMAIDPAVKFGFWLVAADGGVFAFGDAPFLGSGANSLPNGKVVGIASTSDGHGYMLINAEGDIFEFGDATPPGLLCCLTGK